MATVVVEQLAAVVGAAHLSTDPDVLDARCVDWTGRYRGRATALVRPGNAGEVAAVLAVCRDARVYVTVQGGRTSLVAGTVPEHDDVLLSTERLTALGEVDRAEGRIRVGAGVTLARVQDVAAAAGLLVGVDLASRESATIGGMAATNAGGLHTVRYGAMREQVTGLEVALPDGSVLQRHSGVRSDNTGYDLPSLLVGSEGTLGVITEVDLRLRPVPTHRVTALCGFADLDTLVTAARTLREIPHIAALELIDGRAAELGLSLPVAGAWLLLVELAGDTEQTSLLADALADLPTRGEPVVGVDPGDQQRLWRLRESLTETIARFGPPLKFDVALPLSEISRFAAAARKIAGRGTTILFGHIGEGNLHLNILGCDQSGEAALYGPMMDLIGASGGNVSSEHGVGSRKRDYLSMSRGQADISAMRRIKAAFDPTGYLNAAVLFD
jgi:FAD/FMN-containing dehydrogenase